LNHIGVSSATAHERQSKELKSTASASGTQSFAQVSQQDAPLAAKGPTEILSAFLLGLRPPAAFSLNHIGVRPTAAVHPPAAESLSSTALGSPSSVGRNRMTQRPAMQLAPDDREASPSEKVIEAGGSTKDNDPVASMFSNLFTGGSGKQIYFGVLQKDVDQSSVPSADERAQRRKVAADALVNIDMPERERRRLAGVKTSQVPTHESSLPTDFHIR
jgi:hypothetical protein